jgi:hypothetical protein
MSVVQGLPSLQVSAVPGVQTPAWQISAPLHTVPSAQDVPLATAGCWQPATASQESVVQGLPSLQSSAGPAVQRPAWQVSAPLHTVPSTQGVPLATAGCWQPATALHESVVQGLPSLQLGGVPGVHAPAWQVSAPLHTVASAQDAPSGRFVFWHCPALHTSVVQGLPSKHSPLTVQGMHAATGVCVQPVTALQPSTVHALPSLQLSAVPGVHVPAWQVSAPLHTVVSVHGLPLARVGCWQPASGSHESVVQGLPSSQLSAIPGVQSPVWQVSVPLHVVVSVHGVPLATGGC